MKRGFYEIITHMSHGEYNSVIDVCGSHSVGFYDKIKINRYVYQTQFPEGISANMATVELVNDLPLESRGC